jgi:hypothetical protein
MLSGLFLAAMSIDRLLAVRFPMAAVRLCTTKRAKITVVTTKRAKITVVVITIPIVAINLHTFFVMEYIEDLEAGWFPTSFDEHFRTFRIGNINSMDSLETFGVDI